MQQMKRLALVGGVLVLVAGAFVGWYSIAANYDYGALAGTYTLSRNGETCTLHLRPDQTFTEELNRGGVAQEVQGRWRRYGEAHVSFSGEFLKVSGQELNASGESHGQFDKALGLFPSLTLAPLPDGPTFPKKLSAKLAGRPSGRPCCIWSLNPGAVLTRRKTTLPTASG